MCPAVTLGGGKSVLLKVSSGSSHKFVMSKGKCLLGPKIGKSGPVPFLLCLPPLTASAYTAERPIECQVWLVLAGGQSAQCTASGDDQECGV